MTPSDCLAALRSFQARFDRGDHAIFLDALVSLFDYGESPARRARECTICHGRGVNKTGRLCPGCGSLGYVPVRGLTRRV